MQFGKMVKQARIEKGVGLRELARQLSCSPTYVSRIENGDLESCSEELLVRWARFLGLDPDHLLAVAGRIPQDIVQQVLDNPAQWGALLRTLRGLDGPSIGRLNNKAREVLDGKW